MSVTVAYNEILFWFKVLLFWVCSLNSLSFLVKLGIEPSLYSLRLKAVQFVLFQNLSVDKFEETYFFDTLRQHIFSASHVIGDRTDHMTIDSIA